MRHNSNYMGFTSPKSKAMKGKRNASGQRSDDIEVVARGDQSGASTSSPTPQARQRPKQKAGVHSNERGREESRVEEEAAAGPSVSLTSD